MSYSISKQTGLNKNYYGYVAVFNISFIFHTQRCEVAIEIYEDEPNRVRLHSLTDGYRWLQFFLCQKPGTDKLEENLDFDEEVKRCQEAFAPFDIEYEQEDKETAWLKYYGTIDEAFAKTVAKVIEPRFANRERFFKDDSSEQDDKELQQ